MLYEDRSGQSSIYYPNKKPGILGLTIRERGPTRLVKLVLVALSTYIVDESVTDSYDGITRIFATFAYDRRT